MRGLALGKTPATVRKSRAAGGLRRWRWPLVAVALVILSGLAFLVWQISRPPTVLAEAPEAPKILAVQQTMPFQILTPAYLPPEIDRANVEVQVNQAGPGGEPMAQLSYRTDRGQSLFIREWVPVNPDLEVLAASRPIETKWGKSWLLTQGDQLMALWVSVGPLRASIYTDNLDLITKEELVYIGNSLGPASGRQVFTFMLERTEVQSIAPPPPVEAKINEAGVQELTLVVTPGGYDPVRFSLKKGVPAKITFRQLGDVGVGNVIVFPSDPQNPEAITLESEKDSKVLEFTPQQVGEFEFHCPHVMYRGLMTVLE
jgi:hypothetical protein